MIFVTILFGLLVVSHVAPFPLLLDAFAPDRVVWRMPRNPAAPTVYLTYDDGPNPTATGALLDVLAREDARATFFLIDEHVTADTAPLVRRMFAEGHGVAVHANSRRPTTMLPAELAAWVEGVGDRIESMAGERPCPAFRPHAGWRSRSMLRGLARIDHQLVGWGWMAWDFNWFRPKSAGSLAGRIIDRASDGLIVVIHDGHHVDPRPDRQYAVDATAAIVPALKARGFRFASVCEALTPAPAPRAVAGRDPGTEG